jgi:uracil DNA glycosylase
MFFSTKKCSTTTKVFFLKNYFYYINLDFSFSLMNMYKELKADIPDFVIPNHGTLSGWARQGVLLLNACLTVEKNKANSHKGKGWEKFTVINFKKNFLLEFNS